jgi:hypothetical protein
VSHPDLAFFPPETKKVLERLAHRPDVFIAIVSGRSVADVKSKVGIEGQLPFYIRSKMYKCNPRIVVLICLLMLKKILAQSNKHFTLDEKKWCFNFIG